MISVIGAATSRQSRCGTSTYRKSPTSMPRRAPRCSIPHAKQIAHAPQPAAVQHHMAFYPVSRVRARHCRPVRKIADNMAASPLERKVMGEGLAAVVADLDAQTDHLTIHELG